MLALAQRILIQWLSPNCNITGSFIQFCYSYTATEIRKDISWITSYESTDVSWRVLEGREEAMGRIISWRVLEVGRGQSGTDFNQLSRSSLQALCFAFFRCLLSLLKREPPGKFSTRHHTFQVSGGKGHSKKEHISSKMSKI